MFKKLFKRKKKSTGLLGGMSPKEMLAVRAVSAIIILAGVALVYGSLQQSEVENLRLDVESTYNTLYSNAKATDNMEAFDLTKMFDTDKNQLVLSNGDRVDGAGGYVFNFTGAGITDDLASITTYGSTDFKDNNMGILLRTDVDLSDCDLSDSILTYDETKNGDSNVCKGAVTPGFDDIIYTFINEDNATEFNEDYLDSLGSVEKVGSLSGVQIKL